MSYLDLAKPKIKIPLVYQKNFSNKTIPSYYPTTPETTMESINKSLQEQMYNATAGIKGKDGNFDFKRFNATSIPYILSMVGGYLQNPSSVSTLDAQKMAYSDSTVYSTLKNIAIRVTSRIKEYHHPNKEIETFIRYSIDNLKIGWQKFLDSMMTVLWAGHYDAYKKWGVYDNKFIIENIIPMPPTSTIYDVDETGQLKQFGGINQYWYMTNLNGVGNNLSQGYCGSASPNAYLGDYPIPLRVPYIPPLYLTPFALDEIIHYTMSGIDQLGNPYGRTPIRSVWTAYNDKMSILQNLQIALTYKASPMVIFYTDPNASIINDSNQNTPIATELNSKLQELQGQGYLIVSGMKGMAVDAQVIDNTAKIDEIILALNAMDDRIRNGLMTAATAGQKDSNFAVSQSNETAENKYIQYETECLCYCLIEQFVKPQILYNNKNETNWGKFVISEQTIDDKLKTAKLLELATKINLLNPKDLSSVNFAQDQIGLPVSDEVFNNAELLSLRTTNISDTNRETNTPYADGKENNLNEYN